MPEEQLDAYLDSVLIGGRERREVVIADYDAGWPRRFDAERERIEQALGGAALTIEHIGSTAVPGLAAKPIVDMLVTVADVGDEPSYGPAVGRAGYELRVREPEIRSSGRRRTTSTCTCGEMATRRSIATSLSAIACARRRTTAASTNASSAPSPSASGAT